MKCRHCQTTNANRPRGLCWSCYYTTEVRALYPSTSKYGRRGVSDFSGRVMLPVFPTAARPGTAEKVAILEQRARARQSLWHPADAPFCGAAVAAGRQLLLAGVG